MPDFAIRIGGTNEFVSKIDPDDSSCMPPGSVDLVEGRDHKDVLVFHSLEEAEAASKEVFEIEGFHNTVEEFK